MMQLDPACFVAPAQPSAPATPSQSPSKNPCKVRVRAGKYRNEPYGARVLPPIQNAPRVPAEPSSVAYPSDIEPTPRPRPNGKYTSAVSHSHFAARFYCDVARAADFASPTTGATELPMVPSGALPATPVPPTSRRSSSEGGSATSRRATPAAEPCTPDEVVEATSVPAAPHSILPPPPALAAVADARETVAFAFVRFKFECCCYRTPFPLRIGDRVLVEGDRGVSMGLVERVAAEKPIPGPVPCFVLRRASEDELRHGSELRVRELEATQLATEWALHYRLPIRIVDTEFQFDCQKLTVFFDSSCFVDFRRLQRALYREYACRIWLVNWKDVRHA